MDRTIRTGSGPDNDTATIDRADIYRALADALAGEPHSDTTFHMDATGRLTISSHPNSTIDIRPDNDRRYRSGRPRPHPHRASDSAESFP